MKTKKFFAILILSLLFTKLVHGETHPRVLLNSDSLSIIYNKVHNQNNVISYNLYSKLYSLTQIWANDPWPGYIPGQPYSPSNKIYYTRYSDLAFVALIENNSSWKRKAITLALQFDKNFETSTDEMHIYMPGWG